MIGRIVPVLLFWAVVSTAALSGPPEGPDRCVPVLHPKHDRESQVKDRSEHEIREKLDRGMVAMPTGGAGFTWAGACS